MAVEVNPGRLTYCWCRSGSLGRRCSAWDV